MDNAKIISVCSQKGGVAKTTTSVNLGIGLAREGKRVLMVDFDPQSDLTASLGWPDTDDLEYTIADTMKKVVSGEAFDPHEGLLKNDEGVDLLPANIDLCDVEMLLVTAMNRERVLEMILKPLKNEYDYIIIDCMPSLGLFSVNALVASDEVIIPIKADALSFRSLRSMFKAIFRIKKVLNGRLKVGGLLLTMVRRDNLYSKERVNDIREVAAKSNIPIYKTYIPLAVSFERASDCSKSIFSFGGAEKEHRVAYSELVKEVLACE